MSVNNWIQGGDTAVIQGPSLQRSRGCIHKAFRRGVCGTVSERASKHTKDAWAVTQQPSYNTAGSRHSVGFLFVLIVCDVCALTCVRGACVQLYNWDVVCAVLHACTH